MRAQDADKSDYVDAQEFKSIFSDIGEKHSDERMAEIDGIRDRGDADGRLSANEFCDFMMEYFADLSDKAFREKMAEWHEHLSRSHRKLLLRRVFARMDVDQGYVYFYNATTNLSSWNIPPRSPKKPA